MSPQSSLDAFTGHLIRRALQRHNSLWQRLVSRDVSSVQYAVLAILDQKPQISQNELGANLDLDRSTVAVLIARMLKSGLISREQDPDDRRRNLLSASPEGERELKKLTPKVVELNRILVEDLNAAEVSTLHDLLHTILRSPDEAP